MTPQERAAELLPCKQHCPNWESDMNEHVRDCPAYYRKQVASALDEAENPKINIRQVERPPLHIDLDDFPHVREIAKLEAEAAALRSENQRLWRPMECGHPGACYSPLPPSSGNEPEPENWPASCLMCRAIAAARIECDALYKRGFRLGILSRPEIDRLWREYDGAQSFGEFCASWFNAEVVKK